MTPGQREELIANYLAAGGMLVGSAGARLVMHLCDLAEAGMQARGRSEYLGAVAFFRDYVWTPGVYGALAGSCWFLYRGRRLEQAMRRRPQGRPGEPR